jgi:hypothetical protein
MKVNYFSLVKLRMRLPNMLNCSIRGKASFPSCIQASGLLSDTYKCRMEASQGKVKNV